MENPAAIAPTVLTVSILHICLAVIVFLRLGGRQFLFSGSFALAGGLFFGFPGVVLALMNPAALNRYAVVASWTGLAGTLGVAIVAVAAGLVRTRSLDSAPPPVRGERDLLLPHTWPMLRLLLLAAAGLVVGAEVAGLALGPLPENVVYVAAIACFAEALILRRTGRPGSGAAFARWGLLVVVYGLLFVDSGGRLIAATFVYSHGVLLALLLDNRWIKPAAALGILPAMLVFGYIRSASADLAAVLSAAEGLDSMISPYKTLALTMEHVDAGHLATRGLDDLLATLLFWVPRALWPAKPVGFGFVLTLHFLPQLAGVGHSMAATYLGELFTAARWPAVAGGLMAVAALVAWGDRAMLAAVRSGRLSLVRVVVLAILAAGMFDFVWVGSFTFFSRNVLRIAVLAGLAAAASALTAMVSASLPSSGRAPGR